MYLLGYDCGTSFIKGTLMEAESGRVVGAATEPGKEMAIASERDGWAEQNPAKWWENIKAVTRKIIKTSGVDKKDIKAIGISYQMHGLICADKSGEALRPAIIWCDSRAVETGRKATEAIGAKKCLGKCLNGIGNFTAAKLGWVKENEPAVYKRIYKIMLPGDYMGCKMTGDFVTTESGLSEGIFWDFKNDEISKDVLRYFDFSKDLFGEVKKSFEVHGELSRKAAEELGLEAGTMVSYRAGDQPNNAFSLGVLEPGEIAATAGTSGVVYGITDKLNYDKKSRVNIFMHVNNAKKRRRNGVLLCVNGAGILNKWVKHNFAEGIDYAEMNKAASRVPVGSEELAILPYGNGAERTLENRNIGCTIGNLNFNIHSKEHIFRAAQEAVAFGLNYGAEVMREMGIKVKTVRAGKGNMFLSPIFSKTFATITGATIELYNTDGSQGAARGAGIGAGIYKDFKQAFRNLDKVETIEPDKKKKREYLDAYNNWHKVLIKELNRSK